MSQPDVADLSREPLSDGAFPASRREEFRVHLAPAVHAGVAEHAARDTSVEICGVLVGEWKRDADGPFAIVSDYIRCDTAAQKFAEVTFTHESWAQINREMDTRFQHLRIVGWYHSHPNFGIFLSERDTFIQQHFFSGPGQVAYVVDPVRKTEGMFEWRRGKPVPMDHYWIGDRIRIGEVSEPRPMGSAASAAPAVSPPRERDALPPLLPTFLLCVCVFLLGYLIAGKLTQWERERIIEGTVAHYGIWTGLRPGLEDHLGAVEAKTDAIARRVKALADQHVASAGNDDQEALRRSWQEVQTGLDDSRRVLRRMQSLYGYSEEERAALRRFLALKQQELHEAKTKPERDEGPATRGEKPAGKGAASTAAPTESGRQPSSSEKPPPAQPPTEARKESDGE